VNKKLIQIFADVIVENPAEMKKLLLAKKTGVFPKEMKLKWETESLGFIQLDGGVREYAIPPKGFRVLDNLAHAYKYGNYYAVRKNSKYSERNLSDKVPLPKETLLWKNGKWKPVSK
jgi:hypothetical protein